MAYPYRVNEGDIWSGLMSRKKRYQNPFPDLTDPNWSGVPRSWQSNIMSPGAKSSMTQGTQTAMAGKKGLSLKNMINAMSKMKASTGMDFGRVGGRTGGSRPTAPSPRALGVDALEMASADDPRKKWWRQWQGLMGA